MKLILKDQGKLNKIVLHWGSHHTVLHPQELEGFTVTAHEWGVEYRHESADLKERMEGLTAEQMYNYGKKPEWPPYNVAKDVMLNTALTNKPEDASAYRGGSKCSPQEQQRIIMQYVNDIRGHFAITEEEWQHLSDDARLSFAHRYEEYIKVKGKS